VVGFAYAVVRVNMAVAITRMEHTALKLRRHGALVHSVDGGRDDPSPGPLCGDPLATDGCRASCQPHPVQDGHADDSLGLLGREAAGSQPGSHQRFVAAHCCFYRRTPTGVGRGLPSRSALFRDHLQMAVALWRARFPPGHGRRARRDHHVDATAMGRNRLGAGHAIIRAIRRHPGASSTWLLAGLRDAAEAGRRAA